MAKTAKITRQRVGKMMRTLFEILVEKPDGIQAREAIAELEKRVPPADHESGSYPSGGRRYEKIVRFSAVDLVKAGWMQKGETRTDHEMGHTTGPRQRGQVSDCAPRTR